MGDDLPWIVQADLPSHEWHCIAQVSLEEDEGDLPRLEAEANLSLMVAAPEMFAALKAGRQKLATYVGVYSGDKELLALLGQWDAALDRAEGLR